MSNAPKKFKDVPKPVYKYEDEFKESYYKDYEMEKRKQMLRKKKVHDKEEFIEENENKFYIYSEDDTNCDISTHFHKYYLDCNKYSNYKRAPILKRNHLTHDYEM